MAFGFNRSMDPIGAIAGLSLAAALVYFTSGNTRLMSEATYRTLVLVASVPALGCILLLAFAVKEPETRSVAKKTLKLRGTLPPKLWRFLLAVFVFNLSATSDAFLVLRAQELKMPLWGIFALLGLFNLTITLVVAPIVIVELALLLDFFRQH